MRIAKLHIANFRSILDENLPCDSLTVLIGRNGAGKSAFLQALRLYMDPGATVTAEDYYARDNSREIEIEVTFTGLNEDEKAEFKSNLDGENLVVQRRFPSGNYYGRVRGCPELEPIREKLRQKGTKVGEVAEELKRLVDTGTFPGLKAVGKGIDTELDRWESENQERCSDYFRAGIFQGPTNIAGGKLRGRTHFVYIPPVREAELDASGTTKQSVLGTLVGPLLGAITERNSEVSSAKSKVLEGYGSYKTLIEKAPEKETLETDLTGLLRRYDSEAGARIQLSLDDNISLPAPKPKVWLVEDGFEGDVARKGHGLQRLFIFTILELYEKFRVAGVTQGTIVLAVEEPELYQHPARSRALAKILKDLCYPKGGAPFDFQVFYTTHSPYFVDLDFFPSIRRVEKTEVAGKPMASKAKWTTLQEVGSAVMTAFNKVGEATEASSWARLKSILGLRGSEGFFADAVVLVEGQEDEAIVSAFADFKKVSLDEGGVAIIAADGKTNLPLLLSLYTRLKIPSFVIFDADGDEAKDADAQVETNKALLALMGQAPQPRPNTQIFPTGAVWKINFDDQVKSEIGADKWNKAYAQACGEYQIPAEQGRKKFAVVKRTMALLLDSGATSDSLSKLWESLSRACQVAEAAGSAKRLAPMKEAVTPKQ